MKFNKDVMKFQNKLLGILCMALVPVTLLFGAIGSKYYPQGWQYSVSANFYTNAKIFMIGTIFAMVILFASYIRYTSKKDKNGKEKKDYWDLVITKISAVSAFGILAFPCDWAGAEQKAILLPFFGLDFSHIVHCICATVLFASFAVMVGWRFTMHDKYMTRKKWRRNCVYYVCAVVIVLAMITQAIASFNGLAWATMLTEFCMLEAFGFAWCVKGELFPFFND